MDDIQPQNPVQQPQFQPPAEQPEAMPPAEYPGSQAPKKKRGKTVLLVLLALLLVAGAAVGGWYYGTSQAQKDADAQAAALNAKIATLEKQKAALTAAAAKTSTTDKNKGYLVIKQWNVRIKQPTDSVSYELDAASADKSQVAVLTNSASKALTGLQASCKLVVLTRSTTTPSATVVSAASVKKIGDYYYYASGSQTACSTDKNEAVVKAALLETANTVEAAQ